MTFEQKGLVMVDIPDQGETTPNMEEYIELAIEVGAEEVTLEADEEGKKFLQVLIRNFIYWPGQFGALQLQR